MRMSEAKTTNKKVLTLNDIRGVDLSSAPLRVKSTRASYMKNMICKDGVNHKRNGFEQVAHIQDKGEGVKIHSMVLLSSVNDGHTNKDSIFTYAGNKLFLSDGKFTKFVECVELAPENNECVELAPENNKVKMFYSDNLFVLTNKKLYKYNGWDLEGGGALEDLFGSEGAYVPTTSIGITDKLHGGKAEPFEAVNLFSTKRVNKLLGEKRGINEKFEEHQFTGLLKSKSVFYLDGEIDFSKDVKIEANVFVNGGTDLRSEEALQLFVYCDKSRDYNVLVKTKFEAKENEKINGISTFIFNNQECTVTKFEECIFTDREENAFDYFTVFAENENGRGKLTFEPALPSPVLGEDNITVEYSVVKDAPIIKEACELNIGGNTKMLAIVTKDDIVYFSSPSEGYSYFPDNSYVKAQSGVSALIPGNGFLGIASNNEITNVSLTFDTSRDRLLLVPRLLAKISDVGCIAPLSVASLEGDTLFLSKKGIYGLTENGAHLRSSNVNKEILSFNGATLGKAHAAIHNGQYYLFIDGNVYIADARYKTYESQRLDVSYEYEWWRWEDVPCQVAVVHQGQMLLGRDDGRVMKLGNGYGDKICYELSSNNEALIKDGEIFDFDEALGVNEKDKIVIKNALSSVYKLKKTTIKPINLSTETSTFHNTIEFDYEEFLNLLNKNVLYKDAELAFNGKASYIDENDELTPSDDVLLTSATVIDVNYDKCTIQVKFNEFYNAVLDECTVYTKPDSYYIPKRAEKEGEPAYYQLYNQYNEMVTFVLYDDIEIMLEREAPVECELHTAVLNFGTDVSKKTLHKMVLVPSADTVGEVSVGFETDKSEREKHQVVSGALSFDNLDFNSFSFDTTFYKTFEKRMHERNVSFVKFKFKSSGEGDFAIENFSCIYSLNSR